MHHPGADEAERQPGDSQQHGVRHPQPFGERHQQTDQGQQHGNRQQCVDDVGHAAILTLPNSNVISYALQFSEWRILSTAYMKARWRLSISRN
jgi:hypothetical protein